MLENLNLLKPDFPLPGSKAWLVVEHLTSVDRETRGEPALFEAVIRVSLCDTKDGMNAVPVYELLLESSGNKEVVEAQDRIRTWASAFMLGAQYAGCRLGLTIKSLQPDLHCI